MTDQLISIGMPVYNGEQYLERSIRANLAQTYTDFELIISDNASTDRTESICRAFASADSRIRYIRNQENIGAAENYNQLFRVAKGDFFRWTNADDLVHPELLEKTLAVLRSRPDVVIAYGKTEIIDGDGKSMGMYDDNLDIQFDSAAQRYRQFYKRVRLTNAIYGLMRSSAVAKTKKMGNGKLPAGDISFMAAMILLGKFVEIPQQLFQRRMHDRAFSSNPDPQDELAFWTGGGGELLFPHWRAELANISAIFAAGLPLNQVSPLLGYSLRRLFWQRRALARDIVALVPRRS
jgi:glycosyltransferase involved in cell wall biosynthesis